MPLAEKPGDKSQSRYCGVETDFNGDMPRLLTTNLSHGGFDFVVAPLVRLVALFPWFSVTRSMLSVLNER